MSKTYKIALGVFFLLLAGLVWLEANEPEPINWSESYSANDKIPLGTYLFYENWKNQDPSIRKIEVPPYEYLEKQPDSGTYFFLNNVVNFDKSEMEQLLSWVANGNQLMISSHGFGQALEDTLGIRTAASYLAENFEFKSKPQVNLVNPSLALPEDGFFDYEVSSFYFTKFDTLKHTVLGNLDPGKGRKRVNFLKVPFGKGQVFLHSTPEAFSNFFMLKGENKIYVENLLSYFRGKNILWDAYYKSGKSFYTSPLYILLNNRSLKWAYYFILISAILFILFEGKRKQRAIPVKLPLQNRSYEYTQTIGELFIEDKSFYRLGINKIKLFMEYLRSHLKLDISSVNASDRVKVLAARSGNSQEDTKELVELINSFQQEKRNDKEAFLKLSRSINAFKNNYGKSNQR
ncbi:DUF4350 domain-containing protein [Christiangramia flava]|uniref:Uncharacterized protein n=1 Tax=Christiangramia flava JLT2011 TaxID=1229726 RepID=A0A1L7I7P1_9FLAO|nr:DUF4350 domain-containing protein [Christiangramia flava]APU69606.1 hypothetical protein GRFL_2882 [Christiangramia flava JLT2011]OSS39363.1 hypothetical protein C723_1909 [Christiangramia flava JLT2011]